MTFYLPCTSCEWVPNAHPCLFLYRDCLHFFNWDKATSSSSQVVENPSSQFFLCFLCLDFFVGFSSQVVENPSSQFFLCFLFLDFFVGLLQSSSSSSASSSSSSSSSSSFYFFMIIFFFSFFLGLTFCWTKGKTGLLLSTFVVWF